ncbi:MAG: glycosyltransferase [Ferruginibacter sp.]
MRSVTNMLIIGSFSKGSIENYYKRGLEKCGVAVTAYGAADEFHGAMAKSDMNRLLNKISPHFFYKGINKRLLTFIAGKNYEVILVFKGMELYEETVLQLKRHTTLLVNYNCDHPFSFYSTGSGNDNVRNSIKQYDIHFSYSRRIVAQLQQDFGRHAYCIPFGYDSHVKADALAALTDYSGHFLFIGAYDKQRTNWLENLAVPDLDIYGDTKWKTRNLSKPYITQAYKQRALYDGDYLNAVNHSMGIINLLRDQNIAEDSHNMRTFEVPGYGGLLISQRTAEQMMFFEEDKEAIFFDTAIELKDKLTFLRKHPAIVSDIKKAGYQRSIDSKYSYDERSRELLGCLAQHFN